MTTRSTPWSKGGTRTEGGTGRDCGGHHPRVKSDQSQNQVLGTTRERPCSSTPPVSQKTPQTDLMVSITDLQKTERSTGTEPGSRSLSSEDVSENDRRSRGADSTRSVFPLGPLSGEVTRGPGLQGPVRRKRREGKSEKTNKVLTAGPKK